MTSEIAEARGPAAAPQRHAGQPAPKIERLEIRGLSKWYGAAPALRDFDLEVRGGEFISLLGPSGCGKTTALNCVAGLLEPDAGRIVLDGRNLGPLPPERRGFGMVFQNYALFPHLTVARNVAFGLEMIGAGRAEIARRVRDALVLVHLAEAAGRYPAQLSGGQQQRVALARAIVTEPRLLLMDEPLSNLDAKLRLEMRLEIRRLHQSLGLTTLYVTHDQEEALSLSDRIVLIRGGVIQQIGVPEDVYGNPRTAYVANFLGYRNLLPVTVGDAGGGGAEAVTSGGDRLLGTPRGALERGQRAVAAIRAEDIEVLPAPAESAGPGSRQAGHGWAGPEPAPGRGSGPADAGQPVAGRAGMRPADSARAGEVPARIELVEFVGDGFEFSAETGSGLRVVVRTPRRWPRGSAVVLRLPPARLLVFPEE